MVHHQRGLERQEKEALEAFQVLLGAICLLFWAH